MNKMIFSIAMLGLFAMPAVAQEAPAGEPMKEAPKEMPKEAVKEKKAKKRDAKKGEARGQDRRRPAAGAYLKRMDKDGDGKISKDEGGKRMARVWDTYDADKDGFITGKELEAGFKAQQEARAKEDAKRGDQRPQGRGNDGGLMKLLDANGDGKIAKGEAPKRIRDNFEKWDANKDGFVGPAELRKGMGALTGGDKAKGEKAKQAERAKQMGEAFKKADTDGDGKISKEEAPERLKKAFDRVDTDKDGSISKKEFAKVAARAGMYGGDKDYAKPGENEAKRDTGPSERDIAKGRSGGRDSMGRMDKDGDGNISKEEAKGPLAENFAKLDKNGDGKLSRQEMRGLREIVQKKMADERKAKEAKKKAPAKD